MYSSSLLFRPSLFNITQPYLIRYHKTIFTRQPASRSQAQLTTRAGTGGTFNVQQLSWFIVNPLLLDLRIRATSFNSMNKKVLNYQEKKIFVILEPGSGKKLKDNFLDRWFRMRKFPYFFGCVCVLFLLNWVSYK